MIFFYILFLNTVLYLHLWLQFSHNNWLSHLFCCFAPESCLPLLSGIILKNSNEQNQPWCLQHHLQSPSNTSVSSAFSSDPSWTCWRRRKWSPKELPGTVTHTEGGGPVWFIILSNCGSHRNVDRASRRNYQPKTYIVDSTYHLSFLNISHFCTFITIITINTCFLHCDFFGIVLNDSIFYLNLWVDLG